MFGKSVWRLSGRAGLSIFRFRHTMGAQLLSDSCTEKVTVCGAGNPLGSLLAFLLKQSPLLKELSLYDNTNVRGIALDLNHMATTCKARPNSGDYSIKNALRRSDIVVITEGYEAALTISNLELMKKNATMIYQYASKIAGSCPEALVCILTPPVHIMVQVFSEAMKICGAYNPNRIFGMTSLGEMRANSLIAEYLYLDPAAVNVPIIGGTTPSTSVPLLSHAKPYREFSDEEVEKLTNLILKAPKECENLKTAAPMSTAYAASRFVLTLVAGFTMDCALQTAFIRSEVLPQLKYFATEIRTNRRGVTANYGLPKITDFELEMLSQAINNLIQDEERADILFQEINREARKEEFEHICLPNKPLIVKTPVPPCPPCYPADVCQGPLTTPHPPQDEHAACRSK